MTSNDPNCLVTVDEPGESHNTTPQWRSMQLVCKKIRERNLPVLSLPDVDLSYDVFGVGPPMLLLAGTATHCEMWKMHQVPEFSKDHTVITYDQRGIGKSAAKSKDFSAASQVEDVISLLDHLGVKKAILWGHSMGGRIAQLIALDHPDRVSTLILASTGASFPTRGVPVSMCVARVEKGYERYCREHSHHIGVSKKFALEHPEIVADFMKIRLANPPSLEIFLRHVAARQDIDTSARLSDIRAPTLVMLGGDEDHPSASGVTHKSTSEQLARDIPNAKFVIIPGQGHYYPFVEPEPTNRAVRDFLRELN